MKALLSYGTVRVRVFDPDMASEARLVAGWERGVNR